MEILSKLNLKPGAALKIAGLALGGIIILAFAFRLIGSSLSPVIRQSAGGFGATVAYDSDAMSEASFSGAKLSSRNAMNIMPTPAEEVVTGNTAEDFEVTEYDGTIETRDLSGTCSTIMALKEKDYVIFESANEYDRGCNYSFKVERERAEEILAVVNELDPKYLTESVRTIKRQIDDFTSETDILTKKKESIEKTLNDAITAYDEISRIAAQARDAESLSRIIDSKIKIIERLSQDRINVNEQLDRLARAKADQMDRLDYTYFHLSVYENKFVDGEFIKDSWKAAIRQFVQDTNETLQSLSIGLITTILLILQYALYVILLVIAVKYGWRLAKYIWNK